MAVGYRGHDCKSTEPKQDPPLARRERVSMGVFTVLKTAQMVEKPVRLARSTGASRVHEKLQNT